MTEPDDYPEDDYDDGPNIPAKEEPDCYSCNDAGCPDCGYVDPQDPEHRKYMARQIIRARLAANPLAGPATEQELDASIGGMPDVDLTSIADVGELVRTAIVTVHIEWADPACLTEPLF